LGPHGGATREGTVRKAGAISEEGGKEKTIVKREGASVFIDRR
jgi:hypothetical protein